MSKTTNQDSAASDSPVDIQGERFSIPWEDEAKELLSFVPEAVVATVIKNTEAHAVKNGQDNVCRSTMSGLMKEMGMDLEAMLTSCPYAAGKQKTD